MMSAFIVLVAVLIIWYYSFREHMDSTLSAQYIFDSGKPGPCIGIIAGIHGNEPAGAVELQYMIDSGYFKSIQSGSVRIIPRANPLGLRLNVRYNQFTDMNRQFFEDGPLDEDSERIIKFFQPCDLVIDFHEGWGFHLKSPESLGSTICGNTPQAQALADQIVASLNQSELIQKAITTAPHKRFMVLDRNRVCDIPHTLACYKLKHNEHHILVETSGQNDVQPIWIRRAQVRLIINCVLIDQ